MENPFNEARIRHFMSLTYNEFYALKCDDFLVSEIKYLISETALRDEDKRLCVAFYINRKTCQEVADEFGMSVDTAKRKCKFLHEQMIMTIIKMFSQYED